MSFEQKLKLTLISMSQMYGRQLTDAVITMYVQQLKKYPPESVVNALHEIMNDPKIKTMPIIAEIIQKINPTMTDRDDGVVIANKIFSLVQRKGRDWEHSPTFFDGEGYFQGNGKYFADFGSALTEEIGELGREVVRRMGGWLSCCLAFNNSDHAVVKAQIRDLAETIKRMAKAGQLAKMPTLPEGPRSEQLTTTIKELSESKKL